MRFTTLTLALVAATSLAAPSFAQDGDMRDDVVESDDYDDDGSWTGVYVGGRLGYAGQSKDNGETVLFDTNLDGTFGDTVRTGAGADAFSTGFCGGSALASTAANGCAGDEDGADYAVHVGFDYDFGSFVVGAVGEYGRADISDSVTAFSTTPASYTLVRELEDTFGLRARLGFDLGSTLIYATGGGVYGKLNSTQFTSNAVNAFATRGGDDYEFGYRYGGGIEQRVGRRFSIGAQYLFTQIKDDEFRVDVTRGTAAATNPFILVNPNGTTFARSDDDFENHSVHVTASFRF